MYSAIKNNTVQYILDYEPTSEQLKELGCDSYESYVAPEEIDTEERKKTRVYKSLIFSSDLSIVDIEGISFSDKEIGDIILDRVFNGNPHAQAALQAKISAYILSSLA